MDVNKIKLGKTVGYFSRSNPEAPGNTARRGKVFSVDVKGTGHWVVLVDRETKATLAVRPSQVVV